MGSKSIKLDVERREEEAKPPLRSAFVLRRVKATEDATADESHCDMEISSVLNPSGYDVEGMRRSLKLESRPWIVFDNLQSDEKSNAKQSNMSLCANVCLPKGVTRGCSECSECQKVSARWNPEGACTYDLKEAPVFHPSYEEFNDTSNYIDSIRHQVEPYGFCRIVPPPSWRFPCFLEEDDIWQSCRFTPRIQRVNEFQNHHSYTKEHADNDARETKRRKLDCESSDGCTANFSPGECHEAESFQFESGPEFTLIAFKRQADFFKRSYFSRDCEVANGPTSPTMHLEQEPSEQDIEGEYWRIVEKPTEDIEVLYATGTFGRGSSGPANTATGFESLKTSSSGWNLNCISSLPGSLLSLEKSDLSCILGPKLHIGMCFSSVPWNIEEHCLYKLHYMHLGAPRIWYGISRSDAQKFEAAAKKHTPELLEKHSKLVPKLRPRLSPGTLESEGIPVYRCVQRPGDLILFLPGAYHVGFDCGFNCSTSTVFAPLDWLPLGLASTEQYRERKRKTSISYDELLLKAANEVVKARWDNLVRGEKSSIIMSWKQASGKDGVITKALRARLSSEARCQQYISPASQSKKMDKSFDASGQKKECSLCYYDLYLSAATCSCNPNRYSCVLHAKHLCSCSWSEKVFLFRYHIKELNILVEAVEGKITPMRVWIRESLGSALEWDKSNQGENGLIKDPSSSTCDASGGVVTSPGKNREFGSTIHCKDKEPQFEELFSDDFKAKAMKFILKNSNDDDSSSSFSDLDIDACIAELESRKKESEPSPSNR
ncbi:hypothetical protein RND81_07G013000 [Saponaria officinalis]|uniref:Uncharacterized protein n=1 Tax=Saponaria officinalis TaxID=3572 RepID=A0AAW1JLA7_SAPOF